MGIFPRFPELVPPDLTRATSRYKRHAWLAVLGLVLFVGLYVGLAGWFAWTAYRCAVDLVHGGNGVADFVGGAVAALLAVFLLKALFFIKRSGKSREDIEITAAEQPELFAFVSALADRAKAPRPHRVFVSARVNAAVFYDLSLVNLIFPTKKNLEIGLGLVSALNLSELSAVLSHELGHFAQRSMAVGRWVYVAQQVAGQIVATRDWLDRLLMGISNTDIRVAWIGWGLRSIVWSIRSLLDTAFGLVLLAQRALGREMEFQADLVSVSLTGSDALVHALHRLGAADEAWSSAVDVAASELGKGRAVPDLFSLQGRIVERMAVIMSEPHHGASPRLPATEREQHRVFQQELAEPPRMWSTHPANRDREDNAKRVYVPVELDARPAWELFREPEQLRKRVTAHLFRQSDAYAKAVPLSAEAAIAAVDRRYSRPFLDPRYRGVYLGRSVVLPHKKLDDVYGAPVEPEQVAAQLRGLYPEPLAADIRDLRLRAEEHDNLEALHEGFLEAPGGVIRHRGRVVQRRALAGVLAQVKSEVESVRARVQNHDRACRATHRSAARALGQGWEEQLYGLSALLHYAGHARANLIDARGHMANVFAVVTADGRVSSAERERLLKACSELYHALWPVFHHAPQLLLTPMVLERMVEAIADEGDDDKPRDWLGFLPKNFQVPAPDTNNLANWLQVIDSWVDGVLGALGLLERVSLELLLHAEEHVAQCFLNGTDPGAAPQAPRAPEKYATLAPGQERERQKRLDWWNRFQTADGALPTLARLVVAGGILAGVLGFSTGLAKIPITVYNGLATRVVVEVDGARHEIEPLGHVDVDSSHAGRLAIVTTHPSGRVIERFDESVQQGRHYVYNVAGAAALVQWTAVYGTAVERPPLPLGAQRWMMASVDYLFEQPPRSVDTKSGGATRTVISGMADLPASRLLFRVKAEPERKQLIVSHAEWDDASSAHVLGWLEKAEELPGGPDIIARRLARDPEEIISLRLQQDRASPAQKPALCAAQRRLAQAKPESGDLAYLAVRCQPDGPEQGAAFLAGAKRFPASAFFALAAGYEQMRTEQWEPALDSLDRACEGVPALGEHVRIEEARVLRLLGKWRPDSHANWLEQSPQLALLEALDTGKDVEGPELAYSELAVGHLDKAVDATSGDAEVSQRVLRLAAASDGASAELSERAFALADDAGIDGDTIWPTLALAVRSKRPHEAWLRKGRELAGDEAADIERVLTVTPASALETSKEVTARLTPEQRSYWLVMVAVLLQDQTPEPIREQAKRLLFAAERPYLR
ncbi:MAG TPA: M48 family metallopeptidase [Polyangiaceae bacterium]|nr:M48 family metallopeptidase [Polyangiaceae bacterium]